MTYHLAWGICGAGHFLPESFEVLERLKTKLPLQITTFLSAAAEEVVRMYGYPQKLRQISDGSYYAEVIRESKQGRSFPKAGRLAQGFYDAFVVSPVTSNTVAKIVVGIADSLISHCVTQALKGGVPVFLVPTDQEQGLIRTKLPVTIDKAVCIDHNCSESCPVVSACPQHAIRLIKTETGVFVPSIDLLKCRVLKRCITACKFGAISFLKEIEVKIRPLDIRNSRKLDTIEGLTRLSTPHQLIRILQEHFQKNYNH